MEARAKRMREEEEVEEEEKEKERELSKDKKLRMEAPPHITNAVKEALLAQFPKRLLLKLETMMRKVVHEELENVILRKLQRSPRVQMQMQLPVAETAMFRLTFTKQLPATIFTNVKIEDEEGEPLQISIECTNQGLRNGAVVPPSVKVEFVALNGAFSPEDDGEWSREVFEESIEKEREGKRPLLVGDDKIVTVKNGEPTAAERLTFTDNSSWVKKRRFRIGARVVAGSGQGARIREAVTEPFMVKDHRGGLYKKHHPPQLQDDVWRLEKIAKDGKYHKRLAAQNVNTVQDLLRMWTVEPNKLKEILGTGMSDKIFQTTIDHASTCEKGSQLYLLRKPNGTVCLNSICEIKHYYDGDEDTERWLEQCKWEAYMHWGSLEVLDPDSRQIQANWSSNHLRLDCYSSPSDIDVAAPDGLMMSRQNLAEPLRVSSSLDSIPLSGYQPSVFNMVEPFDQFGDHFGSAEW